MPAPLVVVGVAVGTAAVTGFVAWMGITLVNKAADSFGRETGKGAADAIRITAAAGTLALGYYAIKRMR